MKYLPVVIFCLFLVNFVFAAEKIDINTAPLKDLTKIIHIGESRARELIFLRPFSSLDELSRIKGIGEARVGDIKKQGLAWIGPIGPARNPAEARPPQTESTAIGGKFPEDSDASLLVPVAMFTSFASGGIMLIFRRKLYVRT